MKAILICPTLLGTPVFSFEAGPALNPIPVSGSPDLPKKETPYLEAHGATICVDHLTPDTLDHEDGVYLETVRQVAKDAILLLIRGGTTDSKLQNHTCLVGLDENPLPSNAAVMPNPAIKGMAHEARPVLALKNVVFTAGGYTPYAPDDPENRSRLQPAAFRQMRCAAQASAAGYVSTQPELPPQHALLTSRIRTGFAMYLISGEALGAEELTSLLAGTLSITPAG